MRQLVGQPQGLLDVRQGLRRVPQQPERESGINSAANTGILTHAEHQSTALVWRVACDGFLQVHTGRRQRPQEEPSSPEGKVGEDSERRIMGTLCQAQQRFPELECRVQLWPYLIKSPKSKKSWDQL